MELHAVVGLATRNRQNMLRSALDSVRALQVPEGVRLTVIVVENNASESCRASVEAALGGMDFVYAVEPVIGIASARNRVAKLAAERGADVLLFFDDDETVPPEWLARMVGAWRGGMGVLIGGPVRIGFDWQPESRYRAFLQHAIAFHYERRAAISQRAFAQGQATLASTNNCLLDMSLFTRHGLSYSARFHTGSDKRFYQEVLARGLKTGWVAEAVVDECWPRHRTSLRYNFHRAGEQEKTRYLNQLPGDRAGFFAWRLGRHLLATLGLSLLLLSRGRSLVMLARTLGRMWGLVSAGFGARSMLYRTTTGS